MKTFILFLSFIAFTGSVYSQAKLRDGIYLVDESVKAKHTVEKQKKLYLPLSPLFVDDDIENYPPVVLIANDFVPFELANVSIERHPYNWENDLVIQLSPKASAKFRDFTITNRLSLIAVVVNRRVLKMYQIVRPVTDGRIVINRCSQGACDQVYSRLQRFVNN